MTTTNSENDRTQAMALRADILAAPDVWLPRREVLTEWLDAFLLRSETSDYVPADSDSVDLKALERFLRGKKVPAAVAA